MKQYTKRSGWIWRIVIALLIFLCISTIVLAGEVLSFTPDASGAISLIPDKDIQNNSNNNASESGSQNVTTGSGVSSSAADSTVNDNTANESTSNDNIADDNTEQDNNVPDTNESGDSAEQTPQQPSPKLEVSDDNTVWSTNTEIEIFSVSYENGEHVITVKSEDGQKVIAPGTENSYIFKFKNEGDFALDCNVRVEAYFTPEGLSVPIKGRLSRYDGKWVTDSADSYVGVASLNGTEDSVTLDAGRYIYYTLDWMWPYESGNDALDTIIGNMAEDEELTFTIAITTTATISDSKDDNPGDNPNDKPVDNENDNPGDNQGNNHGDNPDGGILIPKTGDIGHIVLWVIVLAASLALLLLVFTLKRRKKED